MKFGFLWRAIAGAGVLASAACTTTPPIDRADDDSVIPSPLPIVAAIPSPARHPSGGIAGAVVRIISGWEVRDEQPVGIAYDFMTRPIRVHCGAGVVHGEGGKNTVYVLIDATTKRIVQISENDSCPTAPKGADVLEVNLDKMN